MDVMVGKAVSSIASALVGSVLKVVWGRAYTRHLWKSCFKVAAKNSDFDQCLATKLAFAPALERLLNNTFKADRSVPSASDFAIAVAFELFVRDGVISVKPSPDQIRHFAVDVRMQWLNGIIHSSALQSRFVSVRDLHPAKFVSADASCLFEKNRLLGDCKDLLEHYFASFTTSDSTEVVRVWLPDDEGKVHYDKRRRRIVDVKLNTSFGADRGFFRVGFDYSIERTGDRLHVCFLNAKTNMESGHFGRYSIGRATPHVLWAR